MAGIFSRIKQSLKHGWNLFKDDDYLNGLHAYGAGSGFLGSPNRRRLAYTNDRSIISSIYTHLSVDVSEIDIRHVRTDEYGGYQNDMSSSLQTCLTLSPNLDQGPRQFRQDIAMTLFDKGVVAIVPVDTDIDPAVSSGFNIQSMRVGEIVAWFPDSVQVSLYNEQNGERLNVTVPKSMTAIVENPFYSVMNEPNSTLQRLIRKLNMLDAVDEQSSSGKLDLIIQLPYVIKSEAKREQAEQRRKDIEFQLKGSQYGIAYTDGTEKVTQLNRPAENNLLAQVDYLTTMLYSQLGLTQEIMNGTADPDTMQNYFTRTIEPVVQAIAEAMKKTFLTKTAVSQNQSIMYFRNMFKLIPLSLLGDIVDKFSRNEIFSSNEIRAGVGYRPSSDPKASQLVNSNMPQQPQQPNPALGTEGDSQNGT